MDDTWYLALAAAEAEKHVGATAPNPPVGACLVSGGRILALAAHQRAGQDHAEAAALRMALATSGAKSLRGATLYVTLEPCNHQGRTPPCTGAILESGIARVVFGEKDPNPLVAGGGAEFLSSRGIQVERKPGVPECQRLMNGFAKVQTSGRPWVVHKIAYRRLPNGELSMRPEPGQTTFTSEDSLTLAHQERKRSDAILTDVATVLSDRPRFDVRRVPDHPDRKKRLLAVLSRSGRKAPDDWVQRADELGFEVRHLNALEGALDALAAAGVLRVLVEAGPTLSRAISERELWDERLVFLQGSGPDLVIRQFRAPKGNP